MIYTQQRIIVAAPNVGEAAFTLLAYGKGVVDVEDVLVVVTPADAQSLLDIGVPLDTPWCRSDGDIHPSVINLLKAQFGPQRTVSDAVKAFVDAIAIPPRAIRVHLPPPVPEVYNEFHQSVENIPTISNIIAHDYLTTLYPVIANAYEPTYGEVIAQIFQTVPEGIVTDAGDFVLDSNGDSVIAGFAEEYVEDAFVVDDNGASVLAQDGVVLVEDAFVIDANGDNVVLDETVQLPDAYVIDANGAQVVSFDGIQTREFGPRYKW